ncbi:MAG: DUF177 domain-containing protein [Bacteroidetes bacterium]|nr:DUF177 domain-containing protein [Bacteroidota bacterium]
MVKIDLSAFQEHSLEIKASDVGISNERFSDITVNVKLKNVTDAILLTLEISANARMECDRTLKEFVGPVSNHYELLLHYKPPEFNEDELLEGLILDPKQKIFDATEVIYDLLMLSIPIRKIAPNANDENIQTVFGAPSQEPDDRWSPLLDMRKEFLK